MVLSLQFIFCSCKFRFKRYTNFHHRLVRHFHSYLFSDDQLSAEDGQKKLSEYMTRFYFIPTIYFWILLGADIQFVLWIHSI